MVKSFFSFNRASKIALLIFVIFYIGFGIGVTIFQEKIIYLPFAQDFDNCPAMSSAEKIRFGATRAYYKEAGEKLAVLYHGNAGSACDRDYWGLIFERNGYSYLIVEYEGYSNDIKAPSHEGIKGNVRDVIAFIESRQFKEVLVAGESIGSGPASFHVSLLPPQKLLLLAAFSDLRTLVSGIYWYYPTSLMVNNAFDNVKFLKNFSGRVLIIHGENDTIIPQKIGRTLFENIDSDDKEFVSIVGANHNDILIFENTTIAINNFLQNELSGRFEPMIAVSLLPAGRQAKSFNFREEMR